MELLPLRETSGEDDDETRERVMMWWWRGGYQEGFEIAEMSNRRLVALCESSSRLVAWTGGDGSRGSRFGAGDAGLALAGSRSRTSTSTIKRHVMDLELLHQNHIDE